MIRITKQRKLIMSLMKDNFNHPTADEVYEVARKEEPHISRGTIYRNLNGLAEDGEIRKLTMPMGPDHFDFRRDDHYHFVCKICNKVVDVDIPYREEMDSVSLGLAGYQVEHHRLILVGRCPACGQT